MSTTISTVIEEMKTAEDVQAAIRDAQKVLPVGGRTLSGLIQTREGVVLADMRPMSGILEYVPAEYTITAQAGTPIRELNDAVSANGQYLPFDPVLVLAGATAAGTVAAGISGSGRLRYGGVRDFFLGTRFIDGKGRLIRGGGKVVKNAAGFDFPKLLIGSMGRLGIMLDVTFKVFPRPPAYSTIVTSFASIEEALAVVKSLTVSPIEIAAIDIEADQTETPFVLATRIGGSPDLLPAQLNRLRDMLPESTCKDGDADANYWSDVAEFEWVEEKAALIKVPITPNRISAIDSVLASSDIKRRYTVAGNTLWISWSDSIDKLDGLLKSNKLSGVIVRGTVPAPMIGLNTKSAFADRVKAAMDPDNKFLPIYSD